MVHCGPHVLLPKLTGPATQRHDMKADDAMAWSPLSTSLREGASRKGRHERAMLLPALGRLERRRALWAASDPVHSVRVTRQCVTVLYHGTHGYWYCAY